MTKYIIKRILLGDPGCWNCAKFIVSRSAIFCTRGTRSWPCWAPTLHRRLMTQRWRSWLNRPFHRPVRRLYCQAGDPGLAGTSYTYGHEVMGEIVSRISTTLRLGIASVIFTSVIGIPLGILSATRQYPYWTTPPPWCACSSAAMPHLLAGSGPDHCFLFEPQFWFPVSGMVWVEVLGTSIITNSMPVLAECRANGKHSVCWTWSDGLHPAPPGPKACLPPAVIWKRMRCKRHAAHCLHHRHAGRFHHGRLGHRGNIFNIPGLGALSVGRHQQPGLSVINACVLVHCLSSSAL